MFFVNTRRAFNVIIITERLKIFIDEIGRITQMYKYFVYNSCTLNSHTYFSELFGWRISVNDH